MQSPLLALWSFCLALRFVGRVQIAHTCAFQADNYPPLVISALELMSKNIFCGSVRIVYAIIYTLFLVGHIPSEYPETITDRPPLRALGSQWALISTSW